MLFRLILLALLLYGVYLWLRGQWNTIRGETGRPGSAPGEARCPFCGQGWAAGVSVQTCPRCGTVFREGEYRVQ